MQSLGTIPKHQFILWLAMHGRLATVERLFKWGIIVDSACVLCNTGAVETFQHLFFDCDCSRFIWNMLMKWMGVNRQVQSWSDEIKWIITGLHTSKPRVQILIFLFDAVVFQVWIERNARRFKAQKKTNIQLLRDI